MDTFLEKYNIRIYTSSKTNLNILVYIKEVNSIIKNYPIKKTPGPDRWITDKFLQIHTEEINLK